LIQALTSDILPVRCARVPSREPGAPDQVGLRPLRLDRRVDLPVTVGSVVSKVHPSPRGRVLESEALPRGEPCGHRCARPTCRQDPLGRSVSLRREPAAPIPSRPRHARPRRS
jgi:hypothetical protein